MLENKYNSGEGEYDIKIKIKPLRNWIRIERREEIESKKKKRKRGRKRGKKEEGREEERERRKLEYPALTLSYSQGRSFREFLQRHMNHLKMQAFLIL